jgi:MFS family permease
MIALGLILSSQVHALWQFFVTYAVVEAIGLSGAFGIGTTLVSRWFTRNRGLALGIISTGSGLGTLFIVPGTERLINAVDWSEAFIICGAVGGSLMIAAAFLLRPAPQKVLATGRVDHDIKSNNLVLRPTTERSILGPLKDSRMILFMLSLLLFFFGVQIIMVHLVSYATDTGINPLMAATLISIIGAVSIVGRLATGIGSDKIGLRNTLVFTRVVLVTAFLCLIFFKSTWAFYLFALIFGLCYGGEVPQIPLFISKYWGTGAMATLVGLNVFVTNIGGALGPWAAGLIFDTTRSYHWAFVAGALAGGVSLVLILVLRRKTGKQA